MNASSACLPKDAKEQEQQNQNQTVTLALQRNEENALKSAREATALPRGVPGSARRVSGFGVRSWCRIRSSHCPTRPLMVCRGHIGELRQILWIRDVGGGIRLSAFEALPRIGLSACCWP